MSLTIQALESSDAGRLGQEPSFNPPEEQTAPRSRQSNQQVSSWLNGLNTQTMIQFMFARLRRRRVGLIMSTASQKYPTLHRAFLRAADSVLASPDAFLKLAQSGVGATPVIMDGQWPPARRPALNRIWRHGADAHRLVYAGDLTPAAGVADFLSCLISWCERHPEKPVHLVWLGNGDLRGVLQAQCLPANLMQTFETMPDRDGLNATLARCGLLVAPNLSHSRAELIIEAMTAGLPVLGSLRSPQIRALVEHRASGWLFDPLRPNQMFEAIGEALQTTPEALNEMRAAAHMRVAPQPVGTFTLSRSTVHQHISQRASASA